MRFTSLAKRDTGPIIPASDPNFFHYENRNIATIVGREWYDWRMSDYNQDAELFEKATNRRRLLLVTTGVTRQWRESGETGDST